MKTKIGASLSLGFFVFVLLHCSVLWYIFHGLTKPLNDSYLNESSRAVISCGFELFLIHYASTTFKLVATNPNVEAFK